MITLTWRAGEQVHTEKGAAVREDDVLSCSLGPCPVQIQQSAATGVPVTVEITTDLPALTVQHAVAAMNVSVLQVVLRTTQPGQELTYQTDATRSGEQGSSTSGPQIKSGETLPTDLTIQTHCDAPQSRIMIECSIHTLQRESIAVHTHQVHTVPHTTSSVVIRGVGEGLSKAFVDSIITIPEGVFGVKADQVHKHLLLDEGARAYSDPKLEVSNNDVSCSHGAAIRHCDEEQLFFLRSRGIDEQVARKVIVAAFLRQKIEIDGGTVSV